MTIANRTPECSCDLPVKLELDSDLTIRCSTCLLRARTDIPDATPHERVRYRAQRIRLGRRAKQLIASGTVSAPAGEIQEAMR